MDIRRQMQRDNLIDGVEKEVTSSSRPKLVPLCANYSTETTYSIAPSATVTPPLPTKATSGISVVKTSTSSSNLTSNNNNNNSEEDAIRRARLELADIAIAKQRARQSGAIAPPVVSTILAPPAPTVNATPPPPPSNESPAIETEDAVADEKAKAREEKRRLKELIAQREELEEKERQERKLEKAKIMEDARILKEEQAKARMEAANKKKEEEVKTVLSV